MALKLAANAVDHPGANLDWSITPKLDRERAQKRIAQRRVERRGEFHDHSKLGI
jgi:hypothetical protein